MMTERYKSWCVLSFGPQPWSSEVLLQICFGGRELTLRPKLGQEAEHACLNYYVNS